MNMDKNQARQVILERLNYDFPKAKKELARIKKIVSLQKRCEEAEKAHKKHSDCSSLVASYWRKYNLVGEINGDSIDEYERVAKELYNLSCKVQGNSGQNQKSRLSHSFRDELKSFACKKCKKEFQVKREYKRGKEITNDYDFCSQQCLNLWNQNNLKEQNTEIICHHCNNFFSGQYWHKNNPRETAIHKFCSENCCNTYWNKKTCSSSDCSNLLTSEEICYCSPCSAKQEQIWKNLEQNQQDINKDLDNFNKGLNDNDNNTHIRHTEREREQNQSQQSQLLSEITQLESNPTKNQTELNSKKQQLKDLRNKEKNITKSLPLNTQISILEREIKELSNKTSKTKAEEGILETKKKELDRLLAQKNRSNTNNDKSSDKTALYLGIGIAGLFTLLLTIIVLTRNRRKRKFKKQ